jgi:hypothetical protein
MSAGWNFARRPFLDDRPQSAASVLLFLFGAVLLVINVRIYARDRHSVADVRAEVAALEARQQAAEVRTAEAKAALSSYRLSSLAEESRELSRIVAERRFSWTGLLSRLERTLPSDVGVVRLQPQFQKDGTVTLDLQFVGRSRDAVVPTIVALTRDPAFTNVELRTESQPEGGSGGGDPFQFVMASRYDPESTAAPHAAAAKSVSSAPKSPASPGAKASPKLSPKPAPKAPARPAPRPGGGAPGGTPGGQPGGVRP